MNRKEFLAILTGGLASLGLAKFLPKQELNIAEPTGYQYSYHFVNSRNGLVTEINPWVEIYRAEERVRRATGKCDLKALKSL